VLYEERKETTKMVNKSRLPKVVAWILVAGLAQVPIQGFSAGPPFDQLPGAASSVLGAGDVAQVFVVMKNGDLKPYFGRTGITHATIDPAPVTITIGNIGDPGKDVTVDATIPRSFLATVQPGPITVVPSILIKVGNSTCGLNCYPSGGGTTCQKVCY
jgi:hypothetical protein